MACCLSWLLCAIQCESELRTSVFLRAVMPRKGTLHTDADEDAFALPVMLCRRREWCYLIWWSEPDFSTKKKILQCVLVTPLSTSKMLKRWRDDLESSLCIQSSFKLGLIFSASLARQWLPLLSGACGWRQWKLQYNWERQGRWNSVAIASWDEPAQ